LPTPAQVVARRDADYTKRLGALERAAQLGRSTVETVDGETIAVPAALATAIDVEAAIPGLESQLAETATAVEAATDAADAALEAGLAAGEAGIAAAEEALAAADDAVAQAEAAVAAADEAQTSAAGKNRTFRSSSPPSSAVDGTADGDLWFQVNTAGATIGLWAWTGAQPWQPRTFDSQVIGNLDAGKITAGTIAVERIAAASLTARELAADAVTARVLAADAVLARNIKAAEITAGKLAADSVVSANIVAGSITSSKIAADAVTAREIKAGSITAASLAADAIDGKVITGTTVRSAASGQRLELLSNRLDVYAADDTYVGRIVGSGVSGQGRIAIVGEGGYAYVGKNQAGGSIGFVDFFTPRAQIQKLYVTDIQSSEYGGSLVVRQVQDDGTRDLLYPNPKQAETVYRIDKQWTEQFVGYLGGDWLPIHGRMPSVRGGAQAGQSVPNGTYVAAAFSQSTEFGGFTKRATGVGHEWVVPFAGSYVIGIAVDTATSAGGQRELGVWVNGTNVGRMALPVAASASVSMPVAIPDIVLAKGDVVQFRLFHNRTDGGTNAPLTMAVRSAVIRYLGPA